MKYFWHIIELDIHHPRLYRILRASFAIFFVVYVIFDFAIDDWIYHELYEVEARSQTYCNDQDMYIQKSIERVEQRLDDFIRLTK